MSKNSNHLNCSRGCLDSEMNIIWLEERERERPQWWSGQLWCNLLSTANQSSLYEQFCCTEESSIKVYSQRTHILVVIHHAIINWRDTKERCSGQQPKKSTFLVLCWQLWFLPRRSWVQTAKRLNRWEKQIELLDKKYIVCRFAWKLQHSKSKLSLVRHQSLSLLSCWQSVCIDIPSSVRVSINRIPLSLSLARSASLPSITTESVQVCTAADWAAAAAIPSADKY